MDCYLGGPHGSVCRRIWCILLGSLKTTTSSASRHRSLVPLRPTRGRGIGQALVLHDRPSGVGSRAAFGRQRLVDGKSPGGSAPPLGLVRLPSAPLATALWALDITG